MTVDATRFLDVLAKGMSKEERLILCGFRGDPDEAPFNAWRPRPWKPGAEIPFNERFNVYCTVSSFGRVADGGFRRRGDVFRSGLALMVDDVGTKVDASIVKALAPTAIIETSPDNFQYWYVLKHPVKDQEKFDGVIRSFIAGKLLGSDPGMAGVTRVGRLPGYRNAKPKYGGKFITKLIDLDNKRFFTVEQLFKAFKLKAVGQPAGPRLVPNDIAIKRIKVFRDFERFLERRKMFKRGKYDQSGWREMHCPWKDEHTNGADTGAAIRLPNIENGHNGAFRCHHGSHKDRHWKDLTDWISETSAEEVN